MQIDRQTIHIYILQEGDITDSKDIKNTKIKQIKYSFNLTYLTYIWTSFFVLSRPYFDVIFPQ